MQALQSSRASATPAAPAASPDLLVVTRLPTGSPYGRPPKRPPQGAGNRQSARLVRRECTSFSSNVDRPVAAPSADQCDLRRCHPAARRARAEPVRVRGT